MNRHRSRLIEHANQSVGSYELALSAVVFGLLGWWLDGRLGITPVLMITFTLLGFVGSAVSVYYRYRAEMARLAAETETLRRAAE
ncbi:MAG: AtpZ/AtpI family protein [Acidimicrobiales bacterium]